MSASARLRSTISLPTPRINQLHALAEKRGLPSPAALVEAWINRAIEEGELPSGFTGYSAEVIGGGQLAIVIAMKCLPFMSAKKARMLAAILSAAAGQTDPELDFTMPPGRPISLDLDNGWMILIGRAGPGLRFVLKEKAEGAEGITFTSPASLAADLADMIRAAIREATVAAVAA